MKERLIIEKKDFKDMLSKLLEFMTQEQLDEVEGWIKKKNSSLTSLPRSL